MLIRPAQISDAAQVAQVHVQAWRETYRGIVPDSVLERMSVEERQMSWTERLSALAERRFIAVATNAAGDIVGFAGCGPARLTELGTDGEVYAIYIVERGKRQRAGSGLMLALAENLTANRFASAGLWVFEQNMQARAFYERLGGVRGGSNTLDFDGTLLTELAYVWREISDLKQRAAELSSTCG